MSHISGAIAENKRALTLLSPAVADCLVGWFVRTYPSRITRHASAYCAYFPTSDPAKTKSAA